ncbi:MAG: hypothetical protein QM699_16600 [Amaricoccus sp.]|uniref:hypothetical protein n=1 Tax=Amaricoccus sp. TaxID=1872485 RepID=UPI0039E5B258
MVKITTCAKASGSKGATFGAVQRILEPPVDQRGNRRQREGQQDGRQCLQPEAPPPHPPQDQRDDRGEQRIACHPDQL